MSHAWLLGNGRKGLLACGPCGGRKESEHSGGVAFEVHDTSADDAKIDYSVHLPVLPPFSSDWCAISANENSNSEY